MKRKISNILALSAILTVIGFLMDGDAKEPSILMRFTEFFGMVSIISVLVATLYFSSAFMYNKLQRVNA